MRGRALTVATALVATAVSAQDSAVTFDRYDPLSSNAILAERLVSPLTAELGFGDMVAHHQRLAEQPVDLSQESFRLFVPTTMPANGYGLLVFVPPWPDAAIPRSWHGTLEKRGVIMVTMANAGNDTPVLGRRDPLAILAATNVMQRYRVDSDRVYIGGFSGGSRVAFKLAVGYPDLFKGAFLLAGADALGENGFAPPASRLMDRFTAQSRIVYVSGARDDINVSLSRGSAASLRTFCTRASGMLIVPGLGHELIDSAWLGKSLDLLDSPAPGMDAACRKRLEGQIAKELDAAEALLDQGQIAQSRKRLLALDARYGGLALPRSLVLLRRIEADTKVRP